MKTSSMRLLSSLLFTLILIPSAHAGLIGSKLVATWNFPPFYSDVNTITANSGIELNGSWGIGHSLDVLDDRIKIALSASSGLAQGVNWNFSGLGFDFSTVNVRTNYSGWQDRFLSYGTDFIDVTFQDSVSFSSATNYFELLISSAGDSDVPAEVSDPSALGLMLLALALLLRPRQPKRGVPRPGFAVCGTLQLSGRKSLLLWAYVNRWEFMGV